jgi:hypothetical protein
MDTNVVLPLAAGAALILLIVAGTVAVFLRPSDTPQDR